jgi:hypothetical protein
MIMRNVVIIVFLTNVVFAFSQPQHMNQLIEDVLPDFMAHYQDTHQMEFAVIDNQMPYGASHSLAMKKAKYVEGKVNGGLKDGYYCSRPSIYLVSKDTLSVQFFLYEANKKFPGLGIGDTNIFFFVYQEQTGKWVYDSSVSSHATWYRKGKFIGDFVKESMEGCFRKLEKNEKMTHPNIFVIDDYLTLFTLTDSILPNIPHIPKGHNKKKYCKADDWLIGFPEISFINDTIAVSSKAFIAKDCKKNLRVDNYIQCTYYYLYKTETRSWDSIRKKIEYHTKEGNKEEVLDRCY